MTRGWRLVVRRADDRDRPEELQKDERSAVGVKITKSVKKSEIKRPQDVGEGVRKNEEECKRSIRDATVTSRKSDGACAEAILFVCNFESSRLMCSTNYNCHGATTY